MTARVVIPSKGRLRDSALSILGQAWPAHAADGAASGARWVMDEIEFIEMRPRDAAAWLAADRVDAAFIATDLVLEEDLSSSCDMVSLGTSRSTLVIASREDDGRSDLGDFSGAVVATHLPNITQRWFAERRVPVQIVAMGGSLEGICAAGLADAIVDLSATGDSLRRNKLRVVDRISDCEGVFAWRRERPLGDFVMRLNAALDANRVRYLMFHLDPAKVENIQLVFPGLAAPTVLPLAGRTDVIAVHLVVDAELLWRHLPRLRAIGATGIVALPPDVVIG